MNFPRALSLSLLAHAVLLTLGWAPEVVDPGRQPAVLASLAIAPTAPGQSYPLPQPVRSPPLPPRLRMATAVSEDRVAAVAPAELPELAPERDVGSTVAPRAASPTSESAPAEAARAGVSAEGMRQYRFALAREARRHSRYPPLARERGWEGVAEVRVEIHPGQSPEATLARSSGHELLDRQALEMIRLAVISATMPDTLRGFSFSVPVPVSFSLAE